MSMMMCLIPLGPAPRLSSEAIRADLASRWTGLPAAAEPSEQDGTFHFRIGEMGVHGGLMPFPIPWSDLERPCATTLLWPDAEQTLRAHAGHLILMVHGEVEPLALATLLTQVAASVLAACEEAVGVFWTNAQSVLPRGLFLDMATQILPDGHPLFLWIDFQAGRDSTGNMCGMTSGMAALGHMEIETADSPEAPGELRERLYGLCAYLLERGPVIADGHTVGGSAEERIRVRYADSVFGREGQVMRLVYGRE